MTAIPTIDWTDLATHNDLALLRAEMRGEMGELRVEMSEFRTEVRTEMATTRIEIGALESRLQRSIVTWILAAQGVTLATIGGLLSAMMIILA